MRLGRAFYERSVHDVARDLVGCVVRHGETAGRIAETESYHMEEPACHAYAGLTSRTRTLFGPPGHAYVYFSYGIHSLLNAVAEEEGVGAAVLIRALEPVDGIELMRERRRVARDEELCNGPGKLTQALGIGLSLNGTSLALILVAFSVAGLRAGLIRRWHGRLGFAAAAILAMSSFTTPYHEDQPAFGMIGLLGFLGWLVWVATYSIVLLRGTAPAVTDADTRVPVTATA